MSQTIQLSGYLPKVQTAEAMAVQRYTTYPMDYSTGLPNITIPLYEINVGDISLPITLSYHSSGFRPNEAGGRIATGWTLNAEPSISKEVRGLDDGAYPYGIYNYNADLFMAQYGTNFFNKRVADGYMDAMSDIYYYRLSDKGGSFVLASSGSDKQFVPQPYSDMKITGSPNSVMIEDDNGITYKFGGGDSYIERYSHNNLPVSLLCSEISSKMTKAKISFVYNGGGLVNYDYRSYVHSDVVIIEESNSSSVTPQLTKIANGEKRMYHIEGNNNVREINYGTNYNPYAGGTGTTQAITTQPLQKISFDSGSIVFEGDNRSGIGIYVKDKAGNTVKKITLYCSPYRPSGNADMQHRKLDSLKISIPGGDTRRYVFEYHNPRQVPDRDTRSIDCWGFLNSIGGSNNFSLVPSFSAKVKGYNNVQYTYEHVGTDRRPNVAMTMTGVLSKITNPDGVETTFEYEGNLTGIQYPGFYLNYGDENGLVLPPGFWIFEPAYYSHQLNIDVPVGGLRIRTIMEKDPVTGKKAYREFSYGCLTVSWSEYMQTWGVPKRFVGPKTFQTQQYNMYSGAQSAIRTWYCNPVAPITFNGGSPILYSQVTERKWDGGNDNIWTEYYYTTPKHDTFVGDISHNGRSCNYPDYECIVTTINIKFDEDRNVSMPFSFRYFSDEEYGKLYKKIDYEEDATGKRVVRTEEYKNKFVYHTSVRPMWSYYTYRAQSYTPTYSEQLSESQIADKEVFVNPYPSNVENGMISHSMVEKETVTEYFPAGGSFSITKDYLYTNAKNVPDSYIRPKIRSITTYLDGNKQKEEYFTYSDGWYKLTGYPEPLYPSESNSKHPTGILTEHKVITGTDTAYMRQKLEKASETLYHINSIKQKSTPGNHFDEVLSMKHNYYGNVIETTGMDGVPTAYIWSYNNQHVVAKVENATHQSICNVLAPRLSLTMESVSGIADMRARADVMAHLESLRELLPYAHVYTYLYKPLVGMTCATDPSGKTTYYEYDPSNRLKRVYFKEKNASGNDVERTLEAYGYNFRK